MMNCLLVALTQEEQSIHTRCKKRIYWEKERVRWDDDSTSWSVRVVSQTYKKGGSLFCDV